MPSVPSVVSLDQVSPVRRNGDYDVARLIDQATLRFGAADGG